MNERELQILTLQNENIQLKSIVHDMWEVVKSEKRRQRHSITKKMTKSLQHYKKLEDQLRRTEGYEESLNVWLCERHMYLNGADMDPTKIGKL